MKIVLSEERATWDGWNDDEVDPLTDAEEDELRRKQDYTKKPGRCTVCGDYSCNCDRR